MTTKPNNTPKQGKKRKPAQRKTFTLVDWIAIGLIMMAVISLGLIGYKFFAAPEEQGEALQQTAQNNPSSDTAPQAPQGKIIIPSLSSIEGKWTAAIGESKAELVLTQDKYQITTTQDAKGEIRRYTRGFFKYDITTGKLTLTPDTRTGEPTPMQGVIFKMMTSRPFDIYVSTNETNNKITWVPPKELIESRQIHPLFYYMILSGPLEIEWQKLSSLKRP